MGARLRAVELPYVLYELVGERSGAVHAFWNRDGIDEDVRPEQVWRLAS